jgi:LacI family transcriptional regulator
MKTILLFMTSNGRARAEMLAGVRDFLRGSDFNLQVHESNGQPFPILDMISFWSPAGCIVEGNGSGVTKQSIPADAFGGIPVVYLGCEPLIMPEDAARVIHDAKATSEAVANEFFSLGFGNFAFVGIRGKAWSARRRDAFITTIEAKGGRADALDFNFSVNSGYARQAQRLRSWLLRLPKPCGLMAANDSAAEIVLSICRMADISVPSEIAVIGVDDVESICENTIPTLTSVRQDFRQGGRLAARILLKKLRGEDTTRRQAVFPMSWLVRRGSTRVFKQKDSEVSRTLERIWSPGGMTLSAKDVLSGFSCSRRNAEKRFKWITGRTVLEEISEARLYHAKKLLSETSLQVSDVASLCGYKVTAHFRRMFRDRTGVNPLAWRKANA